MFEVKATFVQIIQPERMMKLQKELKVFIVGKCFKKGHKKIEVSTSYGTPTEKVWEILQDLLVKCCNAEVKHGRAPAGNLELIVQKFLDGQEDPISQYRDDE